MRVHEHPPRARCTTSLDSGGRRRSRLLWKTSFGRSRKGFLPTSFDRCSVHRAPSPTWRMGMRRGCTCHRMPGLGRWNRSGWWCRQGPATCGYFESRSTERAVVSRRRPGRQPVGRIGDPGDRRCRRGPAARAWVAGGTARGRLACRRRTKWSTWSLACHSGWRAPRPWGPHRDTGCRSAPTRS